MSSRRQTGWHFYHLPFWHCSLRIYLLRWKQGYEVGNDNICCLCYADDIVLILIINSQKSNGVHKLKIAKPGAFQFKLNSNTGFKYISHYKYLSIVILRVQRYGGSIGQLWWECSGRCNRKIRKSCAAMDYSAMVWGWQTIHTVECA